MTSFFITSNIVIALGYMFLCFFVVPYMKITALSTKLWGSLFFATCALTHVEHSWHAHTQSVYGFAAGAIELHAIVIHGVQAVAVTAFVRGLWVQFALPERRRQAAEGRER